MLKKALDKARAYIDALTINSAINKPAEIVSTWGKHFSWDNEKRQNSRAYLYDWSYYNGVVFEGLHYVFNVTGERVYADYVIEYLNHLIAEDGSWVQLEQGPAAGYNKAHGVDCYKTASMLLDYYDLTGDNRYLVVADELYKDLQEAKAIHTSEDLGGNYYHQWQSIPKYSVWLDGLYMAQPFMAEYAARFDKAELEKIADRFKWVDENMFDEEKEIYFHAASSTYNSGGYWLRSIGWYIAAMVDVMEYMSEENRASMGKSIVRLIKGMLPYRDKATGLWSNYVVGAPDKANNRLEVSGTSLIVYAIFKAINNGWLDKSYSDIAEQAFVSMCENNIRGENLTDICFIGAPGKDNATFYDNEGKGVGPFIMAYAEALRFTRER